ncbi:hypothetical protein FIBSPDRAFT_69994 [Athelia psychrophila]|uniref:Uncharacterized protein n=1 Tax=Athelia psychrophila TaxID=1759441 RepID=A0A166TT79_9AGAM|nr:hypothetical protein FIBSPDRAFT_69994 [Fibularhizoctonia sp. CBS 109695]
MPRESPIGTRDIWGNHNMVLHDICWTQHHGEVQLCAKCSHMSWGACSGLGLDTTGLSPWPPPDTPKVEQSWRLVMLSQLPALMLEMLQRRAGGVTYFALRVMKVISGRLSYPPGQPLPLGTT